MKIKTNHSLHGGHRYSVEQEATYDIPILNREHAEFCKREAERRYEGKLILKGGMLTVQDANGFCHLDPVLRALTNEHRRGRITR